MREGHDAKYSGHRGRDATVELIGRHFWWPRMATDIEEYVKTKMTHFAAVNTDISSVELADVFIDTVFKLHDAPAFFYSIPSADGWPNRADESRFGRCAAELR